MKSRAEKVGVSRILIPGLDLPSSRAAVTLAGNRPMLYAAVGIHPSEATTWNKATRNELKTLALGAYGSLVPSACTSLPWRPVQGAAGTNGTSEASGTSDTSETSDTSKIVAIGETGLDYYWNSAPHELQKKVLQEQLSLAAETGLPIILHMREAGDAAPGPCADDLLQILEKWVMELHSVSSPLAERPGVLHSFSGTLEMARIAIRTRFHDWRDGSGHL